MKVRATFIAFLIFSTSAWAGSSSIRFDGFGPVNIGMSLNAVKRALGQELTQAPESHDEECEYFLPVKGLDGVLFMFSHGQLVRIDVETGNTATEAGIRIGDSIAKIRKVYPSGIAFTPHQYIPSPQGKYVTAKSPSGKYAIRFESDNGRVIAFYAGRFPEVEYVERCL